MFKSKAVSMIVSILLLTSMLTLAFNIQPVKASGTIYIMADGSIVPSSAPITTVDNVTYTFKGGTSDSIVVQRDNIVIDGKGFTVQGAGSGNGIYMWGRSNVTIKSTTISTFEFGIAIGYCSQIKISGNTITANTQVGIELYSASTYDSLNGNTITANKHGIWLTQSSNYNNISGNTIAANDPFGILISSSLNNTVSGNTLENNRSGIKLDSASQYNSIFGNEITTNTYDGVIIQSSNYNNISGNTVAANSMDGVYVDSSSRNNTFSGNDIASNVRYGIYLRSSSNNTFRSNGIASNTYNFGIEGGSLSDYVNDIDDSNTVDAKPIYYWVERHDLSVPADAGYVALVNCTRIAVQNLDLRNNAEGILLVSTTNSTIDTTRMQNHYYGVLLRWSGNNSISESNITTNNYGVYLDSSSPLNSVSRNNIENNAYSGIYLSSSSNNSISGNLITANRDFSILLQSSSDFNSISGNNITANDGSVTLLSSSFNSISGNNITANGFGVSVSSSSIYNNISGNRIENNLRGGLALSSDDNTASRNNIRGNAKSGIYVSSSSGNRVSENNVSANNEYGIYLISASDNVISANTVTLNTLDGVYLYSSSFNLIFRNNLTNNLSGAYLYSSSNNNSVSENNIISNEDFGIEIVLSNYEDVFGNRIASSYAGVYVSSPYHLISKNTISKCDTGIYLSAPFNTASMNTIINSTSYGIYTYQYEPSDNNTISENTIIKSSIAGVYLQSDYNNVLGNTIDSCQTGIHVKQALSNTISRNKMTNNYISVWLVSSESTNIFGNDVHGSNYGICLQSSSSNNITGNNVGESSDTGVLLGSSSDNNVVGNRVTNSSHGIYLSSSSNNRIYHNNFINNTEQAFLYGSSISIWDDGYPSGGNYWSDYIGLDLESGPDQNQPGSDGIVDAPRVFDANNQDRYPFMTPWEPLHGYVGDGYADENGRGHMLEDVKVTLSWNSQNYTTYTDRNGYFFFIVNDPSFIVGSSLHGNITITLEDKKPFIMICHDTAEPVSYTVEFQLATKADLSRNFVPPNVTRPGETSWTNIGAAQRDRLDDLAAIYYHIYQAVKLARDCLNLSLDWNIPIHVYAWSARDTSYDDPNWAGTPGSSNIYISIADSPYNNGNRPDNREWHEFGHHIMADSVIGGNNHFPPRHPGGDVNHGEFFNDCTADSWMEGFAEFMSLLVADLVLHEGRPELYRLSSGPAGGFAEENLEDPWRAFGLEPTSGAWGIEESAVAAFLWDLYDSRSDSYNMTALRNWTWWKLNRGVDLILHDHFALGLGVWQVLADPTRNMNDMKDVYDAFRAHLGNVDEDADGIDDLDELFILHGFFVDSAPLGEYNGEEVGRAAHTIPEPQFDFHGHWGGGIHLINPRPLRRNFPGIPGSYFNATIVDNLDHTLIGEAEFRIEINYEAPYEDHNYNYTISQIGVPSLVNIAMPNMPAEAHVYAESPGYCPSEPLVINSTFYWSQIESGAPYLLNHTFHLQPVRDVAVTNASLRKTVVGQYYSTTINITAENKGLFFQETFNITVYANTTMIAKFENITLSGGNSTIVSFIWDTSSFAKGNYTISAYASLVPGETYTLNNNCTGGTILITLQGDVNGDKKVDGRDIALVAKYFGSVSGYPPNADINDDNKIDGRDIAIAAKNFGQIWT